MQQHFNGHFNGHSDVVKYEPFWNEGNFENYAGLPYVINTINTRHSLTNLSFAKLVDIFVQSIDPHSTYDYHNKLKLLDVLPNFHWINMLCERITMEATNISLQFKVNETYIKYGELERYKCVNFKPDMSVIYMVTLMYSYFEKHYKGKKCSIDIAFKTVAKDIEKLPQFNCISSVYLYLGMDDTERVLRQWITYLKMHRGKKWTELQYLVILNVPSAKMLYMILYLIPSLKTIQIGSQYKGFIEDVPILKASLKKQSTGFGDFTLFRYDCFTFDHEINKLQRNDSNLKMLSALYEDRDYQAYLDLKQYNIIKPIASLKRNESNPNQNGENKRPKRPISNRTGIFGHQFI
ncbi:hypothetical protein MOUN0_M10550 [Monosporozyma unispora]